MTDSTIYTPGHFPYDPAWPSVVDDATWHNDDTTKPPSARRFARISDQVKGATARLEAIANGGSLSSVFNVKDLYGADSTGAADATAAIQNALNAANSAGGGTVYLPRGTYKISASLIIYSNTTLWLDEAATLSLAAGSNCNLIHNAAWVAGSGRDSNITITGGTWARGSNAGSGQQLMSMLMQRVDDLRITDLAVTSSAGKYSINVYACTAFVVERINFTCFSDGVHLSGACRGGKVRDIWGTTGDDSVALTPIEWTTYQNGDYGDITDIEINGVYTTVSNAAKGVKVLGGTTPISGVIVSSRRVKIANIAVNTTSAAIYLGGDPTQAATSNGNIYDLDVSNVVNLGSGAASHAIQIAAGGTGKLNGWTFSHITPTDAAGARAFLLDATSGALNLDLLTIRDCFWQTANTGPMEVKGGAVINNLVFESCYFAPPASTYVIVLNSSSTAITSARFVSCRLNAATASGGLIQTQGGLSQQVSNVFLADMTVDQCAWVIGDWNSGVSTNVFIDGLKVTTVSGLIFNRAGSTVNLLIGNGLVGTNAGKFGSTGTVNYNPAAKATPTYSASITPIATDAQWQTITVTNGTAFTINAPTNPPDSTHTAELVIEILNSSGGAMGVITWNAAFVFAGEVWANPATTKKRYARFEWNGLVWVCTRVAPADY